MLNALIATARAFTQIGFCVHMYPTQRDKVSKHIANSIMTSTQTSSNPDVALPGSAGVTVGRGNLRGMMAIDMCEGDNEYSMFMDMPGLL
jgi:hypothetical protein